MSDRGAACVRDVVGLLSVGYIDVDIHGREHGLDGVALGEEASWCCGL
jgi:hypothetical protein